VLPRLYTDLASWWSLLSPPEAYYDDAVLVHTLLGQALKRPPASLLELGCGSGTLASHLPQDCEVVLSDLSDDMLALASDRNPGRQTHAADLRTLRLHRTFDAVLIHDALMYMQREEDLAAALQTAFHHLGSGGALLLMPDFVAESFYEGTDAGGGEDETGRAARLLEWRWAAPADSARFMVEMALLLRDADGTVQSVHEQHTMSLFPMATWWRLIRAAGFTPMPADLLGMNIADGLGEIFLAVRE